MKKIICGIAVSTLALSAFSLMGCEEKTPAPTTPAPTTTTTPAKPAAPTTPPATTPPEKKPGT